MKSPRGRGRWMPLGAIVICLIVFLCSASRSEAADAGFRFTVFHTNDEHSALLPRPAIDYVPGGLDSTTGGFARLSSVLRRERSARGDRPVLTVSAGDFLTGSPFAWLSLRESAVEYELLAHMGYDAVVPGNHAWDFGPESFADYLARAGYPDSDGPVVIDSSAEVPVGHPLAHMGIVRTHVVEIGGEYGWERPVKVGFFGLLGEEAATLSPAAAPITFADPIPRAREMVALLEDAEADVIIAITHAGVKEDREIAREVSGIDLIIGGHSHTALHEPVTEEGIPIVQAGYRAEYLGCLELRYDSESDRLHVENPAVEVPFLIPITGDVRDDPEVADIIAERGEDLDEMLAELTGGEYRDMLRPLAAMEDAIPHDAEGRETPMGNLVTDAFRYAAAGVMDERVDVAFQASGQIRGGLNPGTGPEGAGLISIYDVIEQVGLGVGPDGDPGAPLAAMYFTGGDVVRLLETSQVLSQVMGNSFFLQISGLRVEYAPDRTFWGRIPIMDVPVPTYRSIVSVELVGEDGSTKVIARDDEELYLVVGDSYIASFLPEVGERLPRLRVQPRDSLGNPIDDLDDAILYDSRGRELKTWRAVLDYVASSPPGDSDLPLVRAAEYSSRDRLIRVDSVPPIVWPMSVVLVLLVVSALWVIRKRYL